MGIKGQLGVSTTLENPKTKKQLADHAARQQANKLDAMKRRRIANTVYGALTYRCSKCTNTVRVHDPMGDRMIQCKCNNGFFTVLVKDDRKHLATDKDFPKSKPPKKDRALKRERFNRRKKKD